MRPKRARTRRRPARGLAAQPAIDLLADLDEAAELRELSLAREFDEEYVRNGGRLIYAIDAALINFLFDQRPHPGREQSKDAKEVSKANEKRDPYQLFKGPSDRQDLRLALRTQQGRLGPVSLWHLLRSKSNRGAHAPFLLLPGHDYEARGLYDRIVIAMSEQPERYAAFREYTEAFLEVLADTDTAEAARPEVTEVLHSLLFDIYSPHQKFEHLNELLSDRRLIRLVSAGSDPSFNYPELRVANHHVFTAVGTGTPTPGISPEGRLSWWSTELHGRLPDNYAEIDRMALSALDIMNRALDPRKVRIVLLTATQPIADAGAQYFPFEDDERFKADMPFLSEMSFSDLYLRHPKSLLLDIEFLRATASDEALGGPSVEVDIDGWLDTLLEPMHDATLLSRVSSKDELTLSDCHERWAQFRRERHASPKGTRVTQTRTALRRNPQLHQNFVHRWTDYIEKLIEGHATLTPAADNVIERLFETHEISSRSGVENLLEKVRVLVRRLSEQSWNVFFNTVAGTGLELIDIERGGQQETVWSVPSLYFRTTETLMDVIRHLWTPEKLRNQPAAVLELIEALKEGSGPYHAYVHSLCYGLMFAFAGRWPLTRLLAQRAVAISKNLAGGNDEQGDGDYLSGREAYYLLAVATRILSRDIGDLAEARAALEKARAAKNEPAEGAQLSGPKLTGVRFNAEEAAIDVAVAALSDGPRGPLAAPLRKRFRSGVLEAINEADGCEEPHIALKARIALTSEYIASFVPRRAELVDPHFRIAVPDDERHHLDQSIERQIEDIEKLYDDHDWIPVRDRKLLEFAALQLGIEETLPNWAASRVRTEGEYRISYGNQYWDRLALARLDQALATLKDHRVQVLA